METTRESGKKLIKEKAFHVIYEVISRKSASAKSASKPIVEDPEVQKLMKEQYR